MLTCSGPAFHDMAAQVALQTLDACANEDSELIQAMCIRAMIDYHRYVPQPAIFEIQGKTLAAISKLLNAQDMDDFTEAGEFLCDTLLEALRDVVTAAPRASLQHNALPILFKLLRYAPYNTATVDLALGTFQAIVQEISSVGKDEYHGFCIHLLPALMEAVDVAIDEDNESFGECALVILEHLAQHTPLGLPQEFITMVMPKLCRIIFMEGPEASFLHQRATSVIQLMISHEPALVFAWQDPEIHKSGFEMTVLIIERLLGPQTEEVSAAEVGSLAVELVSKADVDTVRPLIPNLLSVSAARLLAAKHDPLTQSLSMLFAHLALVDASEVVNFLASIKPFGPNEPVTGLETVLKKWVDSSVNFVGSDAIKTNVMALANIYKLDDARIKAIHVDGDLIVAPNTSSRIKTRSASKKEPDRYEVISLQLKILKAIVAELPPDLSPVPGSTHAAALQHALTSPTKSTHRGGSDSDDEDNYADDDGWSDASDASLDSAAAAAVRHSHRHSFNFEGFAAGAGDFFAGGARDYDDAVLKVLLEFFVGVAGDAGFQAQIHQLNEGERVRLTALDGLARAKQGFTLGE